MNKSVYLRKIIYVPLDDRPVNVDRIKLAGQSMGVEVIMPPKQYFSTKLDNAPKNSYAYTSNVAGERTVNSQIGEPEAIVSWIENNSADVDGFIVSVDQIVSGGLVGSRVDMHGYSYNEVSVYKSRLNRIKVAAKDKPLYLFDSVMRLASTSGFNGLNSKNYNATRNYGDIERLVVEDNLLSISSVIGNYEIDVVGNPITYNNSNFTTELKDSYLQARKRKFYSNVELLKWASVNDIPYYIGVDDSSNKKNIQYNEISYLKKLLGSDSDRLMSGLDEMAMNLLSNFTVETYKSVVSAPTVKVTEIGNDFTPSPYDYETVGESILKHIKMSGGVESDNGEIEVIVLYSKDNSSYVKQAMNKINSNFSGKIVPTIVIDVHKNPYFHDELTRSNSMAKLLSFSCWNTTGNMVGLALGHGIARLAFMKLGDRGTVSTDGVIAQTQLLMNAFVEDISYLKTSKPSFDNWVKLVSNGNQDTIDNFYSNKNISPNNVQNYNVMLDEMNRVVKNGNKGALSIASKIMGQRVPKVWINPTYYATSLVKDIDCSQQFNFAWNRTFDITVLTTVALDTTRLSDDSPMEQYLQEYHNSFDDVAYSVEETSLVD